MSFPFLCDQSDDASRERANQANVVKTVCAGTKGSYPTMSKAVIRLLPILSVGVGLM